MPVKTVFILGAGASVEDGAPVMSNFLDRARDLLLSGSIDENDKYHFEKVFEGRSKLTRVHSKADINLENLEALFSAFEMAKLLNKMPDVAQGEIDMYIKSLKRLIVVTLEQSIKFPLEHSQLRPTSTYGSFVELLREMRDYEKLSHDISIITFNYDLAIDMALNYYSFAIDYCLSDSVPSDQTTALLKLHGSLNWGVNYNTEEKRKEIIPVDIVSFYIHIKELTDSTLRIGSRIRSYTENGVYLDEEPVIVPPSWNKSENHNGIAHVWQTAAKELGEAENIIVIGFSMPETDSFFKYLYALGTEGENMLRNFIVYDKQEKDGEVDRRYQKLLGPGAKKKYVYRSLSFNNAIKDLKNFFKDGDFLTDKQIIQLSLH